MRTLITLCCLFLLLAGPVGAGSAENVAGFKDTITGTISVPGESLSVTFYAPAGTQLSLSAKKDGKPNPEVTLALTDPEGANVPIEKKKAVAQESGTYRLTMTPGAGLTGMFVAKIKGTPPKKANFKQEILEGDETEWRIPFSVLPDTKLNYTLTKANPTYLYHPDGSQTELFVRKQKGLLLRDAGDYQLGLRGTGGKAKASLKFYPPEIEKRKLWLSNAGFGEAPEISSLDPSEGLSTRPIEDVIVEGESFAPGVTAELVKGKLTIPVDVFFVDEDEIRISMDLTGAKKGAWQLELRNPSGATTSARFKVIAPNSVVLPDGIEDGSEIWYLDFNESFDQDLYEFGLTQPGGAGGSTAVNSHVRRVVKAYVLYWLRTYYGLPGYTGQILAGDVPVSFILTETPTVAGLAGVDYNRIEIGGTPLSGAISDNPNLNWGNSPVDAENASIDDISDGGAEEETARIPVFEMRPTNLSQTTAPWRQTFSPLLSNPVTDTDAGLFSSNPARFLDANDDNIARYQVVVRAIEVLSKEIAAVAAHHIARAMGVENGTEGLMMLPTLYGEFAGTEGLAFTEDDLESLRLLADPILLPGKSTTLRMKPFQMNPGQASILTALGGTPNQEFSFYPTGGRPDRLPEDMRYEVYYGTTAPLGVAWPNGAADGLMRASPPEYVAGYWYTDAVFFQVVATDAGDGRSTAWTHRLNVLVNTSGLSGTVLGQALTLNRTVEEGPAR